MKKGIVEMSKYILRGVLRIEMVIINMKGILEEVLREEINGREREGR